MSQKKLTRRNFLGKSAKSVVSAAAGSLGFAELGSVSRKEKPVVRVVVC